MTQGERGRMMPAFGSARYEWMVKTSDYYEEKAREEEIRDRQKAMEAYHRKTAPARHLWEEYLEKHPTESVAFDWKSLPGTPPGQIPARVFRYKKARTTEQWKECGEELLRCLEMITESGRDRNL